MSGQAAHRQSADEAFAAAQALREQHPAWAVVPLFYSAMHLMHACFDTDALPTDQRHPDRHSSHRGGDGSVLGWGTTDVVRAHYPHAISRAYTSLFAASRATRYSGTFKGGDRLWDDYRVIRDFAEQRLRER